MEQKNIVIGIEGFVGSGKTSMARELLNEIPNSILLHGGNIYRAIVACLMQSSNLEEILASGKIDAFEVLKKEHLTVEIENRESVIKKDGKVLEEKDLQSQKASVGVSKMAKMADNQKLYEFGKELIASFAKQYHVILSSRDIMKMYPDADYHFFITASLEERTRRKCIQYEKEHQGEDSQKVYQQIYDEIALRDQLQEESGFYKIYDKTIVIDVTEDTNPKESAKRILDHIKIPSVLS